MDIFVTAGPAPARGILKLDDLTAPCALGHGGVETAKKEGDGITPAGAWPVRRIWYRPDREPRPLASLAICKIDRKTGWCDDGHISVNAKGRIYEAYQRYDHR